MLSSIQNSYLGRYISLILMETNHPVVDMEAHISGRDYSRDWSS